MLPTKFRVNWHLGLGEEENNRFSRWQPWRPSWISIQHDFQDGCHGGHLGFPIGMILAIFDLQVTPMLPSKFGVNWPFSSGEEAKNRFSRWRPSWISDRNDFSYFWSTSHPDASYQVSSQLAQGCRRSRLLKQLLTPHDGRHTMDDGHWLTTTAHHEHFVLRWAKNNILNFNFVYKIFWAWEQTSLASVFWPQSPFP